MQIRIDRELCMGSGSCQFHAPNTFDLGADCKAIVKDEQGDPARLIRNAKESCPSGAIELTKEGDA